MSTIADKLSTARKEAGMTLQQLSTQYAIPLRTLQDWEASKRVPPEYVVSLLLRCLSLDFPLADYSLSAEQDAEVSETDQEPERLEPEKKLVYCFCNTYGKPLSPELTEIARKEYLAGRVQMVADLDDEEEPIENKKGKLFICTDPDFERGVPFGFNFRVRLMQEV